MFELIGIAVVIWIAWKLIKLVARTATTQAYHQGAAEALDLPNAQKHFDEAETEFISSVFMPMGVSGAEQQSLLDKAVFLKDRVNQLNGGETGSPFRARYRNELIAKANNFGPSLASGFEEFQKTQENPEDDEDDEDDEEEQGFSTFEDWLEEFKDGAGYMDEHLAEKTEDGTCLIDLMDLTPLRRAYAQGVDPYQLGIEFGGQFDFGSFIAGSSKTGSEKPDTPDDDDATKRLPPTPSPLI